MFNFRRLVVIGLIGIFAGAMFSSQPAAAFDANKIEDHVKYYSYYQALIDDPLSYNRNCITGQMRSIISRGPGKKDSPPDGNKESGNEGTTWFGLKENVYVWPRNKVTCAEALKALIDLRETSATKYGDFLTKMNGGFWDAKTGTSDKPTWVILNNSHKPSEYSSLTTAKEGAAGSESRLERFKAAAGIPKFSDAAKYYAYFKSLNNSKVCTTWVVPETDRSKYTNYINTGKSLEVDKEGASVAGLAGTKYTREFFYDIPVYDASGTAANVLYGIYTTDSETSEAQVGGHIKVKDINEIWSGADGDLSCAQMAATLRTDSVKSAWQTWLRDHPDDAAASKEPGEDPRDSNAEGENAEKTCNIDGIGWLVCPVTTFLANISDSVKSRLDGYLRINSSILTDDGEGSVYWYWSVARDYANILFIVAFLVVIYSQITNAGISNYGIKKMLPKIIIGIILVNISFYFCAALADISNILGAGSFNFITASADQSATPDQGGFWSHGAKGGAGTFAAIATIILTTGAVMYFALGTLLMGLISVIFIGITTLIFLGVRQAVIIFMIILSPLAFVAWLLPNTEGLFKKWWSTFKMMLMVYPIIGVVYGASNLASQILGKQYGDEGTEDGSMVAMQIVAAVLAFIPMMIVPKVVNKAMSVGGIANAVGNISGRLQGAANKKAGEVASNSGISQYRQHRKNEANIRRAKKQGGVYTRKGGGANPANWGAAINRGINKRTGKFGDRRASLAASLEDKEYQQGVDQNVARMQNDLGPSGMLSGGNNGPQSEDDIRTNGASGGAAKYLQDALVSGNKEQAAAATKIMLNQGEKGRKQLRGVMAHHQDNHTDFRNEDSVSHAAYQSMQTQINTAGLKGTDNVLATSGYTNRTIDDVKNDGGTYKSLDDYQMAGQSADDIRKAIELGMIDQSRAMEMITNSNIQMSPEKKDILMDHATRPTIRPTT